MVVRNITGGPAIFSIGRKARMLQTSETWELPDEDVLILRDVKSYTDRGFLTVVNENALLGAGGGSSGGGSGVASYSGSVSTTDATVTPLVVSGFPVVPVGVAAKVSALVSATSGESKAVWDVVSFLHRGTVVQTVVTEIQDPIGVEGPDVFVDGSGNVSFTVTGKIATNIDWLLAATFLKT
jgi:hypothetical protein